MSRRFYDSNNWVFRKTPVPYTRCVRPSAWTYYRHPRTFQEMKWNVPFAGNDNRNDLYDAVSPRVKRCHLPSAWNDNPWNDKVRSTERSWKSYRKHQYKE